MKIIQDKDEAVSFLTADGNFRVPCSRYGNDSVSCAEVAWEVAKGFESANGDVIDEEMLDYIMGLVVNDHDDVAYILENYNGDS